MTKEMKRINKASTMPKSEPSEVIQPNKALTTTKDIHASKSVKSFIKSTLTAYTKLSTRLHTAACLAMYHASVHGDPVFLNQFYAGLRVNDQTAFRVWIGKHSGYTVADVNGEEHNAFWISFSKKEFRVKKDTQDYRNLSYDVLLASSPFFEKDVSAKEPDYSLEAILALLGKAKQQAESKAEKGQLTLPKKLTSVLSAIDQLSTSNVN